MSNHIVFVTGKLAKPAIDKVLSSCHENKFTYQVIDIGVSVVALATVDIILKKLEKENLSNATKIIIPGRCKGDIDKIVDKYNIPAIRGPEELKDLPLFMGLQDKKINFDKYHTKIIAEITDAPNMSIEEILKKAKEYKSYGADIIDIGCIPGVSFPHLCESIEELKKQSYIVSIDSLDPEDLLKGSQSGADYLLSIQESMAWILDETSAIPVVIPDTPNDEKKFYRFIENLVNQNKQFIADSILEPINFGFTNSIVRYSNLRKKFPDIDIMMGIGNLTELTHADSMGVNALLFGIASELNIQYALCTQVSEHCVKSIKEGDQSRRLMYASQELNIAPKDISNKLLLAHDRKPFPYTTDELKEMSSKVKDKNYRIYVNEDGIHLFNNEIHLINKDPTEFYPHLDIENDDGHAYYLGMELSRAHIAFQLGKRYEQDELLKWGCAVDITDEDMSKFKEVGHTLRGLNKK